MKNILFIGGAGFIGSNIVRRFVENEKYNVIVFEPVFANLSRLKEKIESITVVRGTLSDLELIKCVLDNHHIDIIVHLVSTLVPGSSYEDYKREFENVVFPTSRLMELCVSKKIKFVFFSSGGTVYGNSAKGGKFKESDTLSPISYYGLTKQILEANILFEYRRGKLDYLIIRPSNPFGRGQSLYGNQGFIAVAIGKILAREPLEIWGDGSNVRDYIYIDDLADTFYRLIEAEVKNEIVNVGSGFGYSVNDVISRIKSVINVPFEVEYKNCRSVDVNSMVLDVSKIRSLLGNIQHTHLEDGIKLFYDYVIQTINKR